MDYFKGQNVRCRGIYTDDTGTGIDPPTVTFRYRTPSGVTTNLTYGLDPAVIRVADGAYYADIPANEAGTWAFRWDSTGTFVGANETVFSVDEGSF